MGLGQRSFVVSKVLLQRQDVVWNRTYSDVSSGMKGNRPRMSPKWIYSSGSLSKDHSPLVTSLFRICLIRSAFVESNLVRDVMSLLIFTILCTVRVVGLSFCDIHGSPMPVLVGVLKSFDFMNRLARRIYREIGNGEARNTAVLTCRWLFTGDEGGFSSEVVTEMSSFFSSTTFGAESLFSSTASRAESLEGFGSTGVTFGVSSEPSGSEERNFSISSTSLSI